MSPASTGRQHRSAARDPRDVLVDALVQQGFPAEFGLLLAAELRSDHAIERLAGYVRAARPHSMEEIVDEMLAIRELNASWRERKIAEHAQAKMTEFYNRPDRDIDS